LIYVLVLLAPQGTNDKPGGRHYVLRWTSPQVVKETFAPLKEWKYPYMS
jgi:1-pyrroline-5-carboxylate dehydrogenase